MVTKKIVKTTHINKSYSPKTVSYILKMPMPKIDGAHFHYVTKDDLMNFIDEITLHVEEVGKNQYALLLPNPIFTYLANVEGFKQAKIRVKIHNLSTDNDLNQFLECYQLKLKAIQLLCYESLKSELNYAIKTLTSKILNKNKIALIANRNRTGIGRN